MCAPLPWSFAIAGASSWTGPTRSANRMSATRMRKWPVPRRATCSAGRRPRAAAAAVAAAGGRLSTASVMAAVRHRVDREARARTDGGDQRAADQRAGERGEGDPTLPRLVARPSMLGGTMPAISAGSTGTERAPKTPPASERT